MLCYVVLRCIAFCDVRRVCFALRFVLFIVHVCRLVLFCFVMCVAFCFALRVDHCVAL